MFIHRVVFLFSLLIISLLGGCKPSVDAPMTDYQNIDSGGQPLAVGCYDPKDLHVFYLISLEPKTDRATYRHFARGTDNPLIMRDIKAKITTGKITERDDHFKDDPKCQVGQSIYNIVQNNQQTLTMSQHFENMNFPGNTIRTVKNISSPDVCSLLCKENTKCSHWSWRSKEVNNNDINSCWLKDRKTTEEKNDSVISGYKTYR